MPDSCFGLRIPVVEEMHKSLKQNNLLDKSPTKMERTQCNHIFATMLGLLNWNV